MNHRRSPGGYHNRLKVGAFALLIVPGCAPVVIPPVRPAANAPGARWTEEREAVVAEINSARAGVGLPPLAYDARLERVGDAHCAVLIHEEGQGHFSRSGVPPYLRYLLAGGNGFHRENAALYSSSTPVRETALGGIVLRSVASMLAETPPNDGHRRSILDPDVNSIGVGLAVGGGEVRMTQEFAVQLAVAWSPPPVAARPKTIATLAGKLAPPWRPEVAEILWEPLPRPLSDAQARDIRTYSYPARRQLLEANRSLTDRAVPADGTRPGHLAAAPFAVDRFGNFFLRWSTEPEEGVEIVLIAASDGHRSNLVPVAASATVVTTTGTLPEELAYWRRLSGVASTAQGDQP